jgi:hypothetical protein
MAKYYGAIGYATVSETSPGIWTEAITERNYYGEVLSRSRRLDAPNEINDGITISNNISIISDPYANQNFVNIKYLTYMGKKWKVANVEVQYPRLILTTGGLYNG